MYKEKDITFAKKKIKKVNKKKICLNINLTCKIILKKYNINISVNLNVITQIFNFLPKVI